MKQVLFLVLSALAVAHGFEYDGLRVKFGALGLLADWQYFYDIPRTIKEAEDAGWTEFPKPEGQYLPELKMYCLSNLLVCPFYHEEGFVAGIHLSVPVDEFKSISNWTEAKLTKWQAPEAFDEPAKEYWSLPQFFVTKESLEAGAYPKAENGSTLQDKGVWVYDNNKELLNIPLTEAEINTTTAYTKCNCIEKMGSHYYYTMTPDLKCEDFMPWFAVVTDGKLVGSGFQFYGKLTDHHNRVWWEDPKPYRQIVHDAISTGPQCLYDIADEYGLISLHVYYVDKPWSIKCKSWEWGESYYEESIFGRLG
ncbi:hypothetical protein NE865_16148 [Phthorimaea operculella]|nr:hypothetical protein NE865_16148 [Phthorimaea operculella]